MKARLWIASGLLVLGGLGCQARPDATRAAAAPGESFGSYGERVFRRQNALMDELLAAEADERPRSSAERLGLARAEARIVRSCRALNEVASAIAGGRRPDFLARMQAAASLRGCSASARAVEKFLQERPAIAPP